MKNEHGLTQQRERGVRRVVDGDMPPEGLNVLFWIRGSWRCGSWIRRDDGICWVVEESSWVEPSPWSERMQRPTHWMPQPEAPNDQDRPVRLAADAPERT